MPWETIVVPLIILIASVAIWVLFWRARARRKVSSSTEYKPEYKPNAEWEEYASFKDGLKFEGMQPQKTIQYGKTRFAYDEAEEKIFIQTGRLPQGMALRYADITSFEMIRDGETIEPRTALPDVGNEPVYSGEACFDLRIVVYTGDGVKTVLPFIDTPAGYEYAYTCAVKAAYEVASVLEDLLRKRQGDNTIPAF